MTTAHVRHAPQSTDASWWRAVLLGGALGDALGAPVEFLSLPQIRERWGEQGLAELVEWDGRIGAVTDDTQLTLFTAEALLAADRRSASYGIASLPGALYFSYQRWLATNGESTVPYGDRPVELRGMLWETADLHHRRAPGSTCLSALHSGQIGTPDKPLNNSKGCGGIMRVAAAASRQTPISAFNTGVSVAAVTHGHPTGYLAAGVFAALLQYLQTGNSIIDALDQATKHLSQQPAATEIIDALNAARALAASVAPSAPETVEQLGQGWIAEEALAIAIFSALRAGENFGQGVLLAINHSGDSDSTGSLAGQLLGAALGEQSLPTEWVESLEARAAITTIAEDLAAGAPSDEEFHQHDAKYPYQ